MSIRLLVKLRVALVQLNPQVGRLEQNIARTWSLLRKFQEKLQPAQTGEKMTTPTPDLMVFPEFALTGYSFHSKEHISSFVHKTKESPSFHFAQQVSKMFSCYTVIGYPERHEKEGKVLLYNSALVVSPKGELVFNYRKSFLYDTEYEWDCEENPNGFETFSLTFPGKGQTPTGDKIDVTLKTSIGICMDLSPYKFEAPFNLFEFASFNLENRSELMICPMAWLHSSSITKMDKYTEEEKLEKMAALEDNLKRQSLPIFGSQNDFQLDLDNSNTPRTMSRDGPDVDPTYGKLEEPDMTNVNYWILRFLPFIDLNIREEWYKQGIIKKLLSREQSDLLGSTYMGASARAAWEFANCNAILLLTNRCGVEDGTTVYAGSSGVYKFNGSMDPNESNIDSMNGSVALLGNLGKGKEGIILRDLEFDVTREL
ncbi:amidase KNAG_0B00210 [Huiozyma naganishii CBS 8797]|uniref:CN hydrolase domain-containing protein n=1 Tax=Huiozyma naganishii (strain ATCC MYA-139 / BCRC 22969 / CBS 8797 / KCTC 17520 / NBRC 10181 / NCYC 3082 / Yp74L-3) TaxID=1071383 RepID=J7R118_HUIN7|nr:hypothetical protein KNAG_0B00210 [Kazachstania naganishii CBS 8797]CCK68470.1 hypothetical protein KNAG_0B00210 [Kazachstania naganishii CBS 8797]